MEIIPDCLVLKIEEVEFDTHKLDTTLFVLYDSRKNTFIIRGKRRPFKNIESCSYSYNCSEVKELHDFISLVICKNNFRNYVLYNYDNLKYESDEITYEFLKENDSTLYELAGYNLEKYNKKKLTNYLNILKNVYNYF